MSSKAKDAMEKIADWVKCPCGSECKDCRGNPGWILVPRSG